MESDEARLRKCFSKTFPDLSADQIRNATMRNVQSWDSLASVTLLMLISEEFQLTMDMDRFEEFNSFASLLAEIRAGR